MKTTILYCTACLFLFLSCTGGTSSSNLLEKVSHLLPVKIEGRSNYVYIHPNGDEVFESPFTEVAGLFFDGLAKGKISWESAGKQDSRWRYINEKGEVAIDGSRYAQVTDFSEGIAFAQDKNAWVAINTKGEEIFTVEGTPAGLFSNGLAAFSPERYASTIGFIDKKGNVVLEPNIRKNMAVAQFVNGFLCLYIDGKYGAINPKGEQIIPGIATEPFVFDSKGNAAIRTPEGWMLIDSKGKTLIPAGRFTGIENDGKWYRVTTDGDRYGWCDASGKMKIDCIAEGELWRTGSWLFYNNDFAYVEIERQPYLIDRQGNLTKAGKSAPDSPFIQGYAFLATPSGIIMTDTNWLRHGSAIYEDAPLMRGLAISLFQNIHIDHYTNFQN